MPDDETTPGGGREALMTPWGPYEMGGFEGCTNTDPAHCACATDAQPTCRICDQEIEPGELAWSRQWPCYDTLPLDHRDQDWDVIAWHDECPPPLAAHTRPAPADREGPAGGDEAGDRLSEVLRAIGPKPGGVMEPDRIAEKLLDSEWFAQVVRQRGAEAVREDGARLAAVPAPVIAEPDNHHNAALCPYCTPAVPAPDTALAEAWDAGAHFAASRPAIYSHHGEVEGNPYPYRAALAADDGSGEATGDGDE